MFDREALYRAILERPDDDAPRLIFADYLEEQGTAKDADHAELIRLQCQLARIPPNTSRFMPLQQRCQELLRTSLTSLSDAVRPLCTAFNIRRGFVDSVQLTNQQFTAHAETLQALAPIQRWAFRPVPPFQASGSHFQDIVTHPAFAKVAEIEVDFYAPNEALALLAQSPFRTGVRGFAVTESYADERSLQTFLKAVPQLTALYASRTFAKRFATTWRPNTAHRLRTLSLPHCRVTNEVLVYLARSTAFAELETLVLDANPFDERGLYALAESSAFPALQMLSMGECSLGNHGAEVLARSRLLANVRVLNLAGCQIDAVGCQAFADSPYLQNLELLCLDRNRVSIGVEHELVARFGASVISLGW